jgi:hypothetical protein
MVSLLHVQVIFSKEAYKNIFMNADSNRYKFPLYWSIKSVVLEGALLKPTNYYQLIVLNSLSIVFRRTDFEMKC